jgi:hypothetical protein
MLVVLLLALAAQPPCTAAAQALVAGAATAAQQPDLASAVTALRDAGSRGCADGVIGALYLQGLIDAAEAFRLGAPAESLQPVHQAIASLERIAAGRPGPAEIARLMLNAAAAASQSERDEMALYLEHAERMETLLRATSPRRPSSQSPRSPGSCGSRCTGTTMRTRRLRGRSPR